MLHEWLKVFFSAIFAMTMSEALKYCNRDTVPLISSVAYTYSTSDITYIVKKLAKFLTVVQC